LILIVKTSSERRQSTRIGGVFRLPIWPSCIRSAPLLSIPAQNPDARAIAVDLSIICKDFTTRCWKAVLYSTSYTKEISTRRI